MIQRSPEGERRVVSRDEHASHVRRGSSAMTYERTSGFTLDNRSGYETADLRRFFAKGLRALHAKGPRHIVVVAAHARSRGCAEIGTSKRSEGRNIVIAIAAPANFCLRRLARLFEHEMEHTKGADHEAMSHATLWSLGGVPAWAAGSKFRYRGRAPSQIL